MSQLDLKWAFEGVCGAIAAGLLTWWLTKHFSKRNPQKTKAAATSASVAMAVSGGHNNSLPLGAGAAINAPVLVGSNNTQQITVIANPQVVRVPVRERQSMSPTPDEMYDRSRAIPPFQRETYWNNYKGIRVQWQLLYYSAVKHPTKSSEYVWLSLRTEEHTFVYCTVKLADYPLLKLIPEKHLVWVEGEIGECSGTNIFLEDVSLEFEPLSHGTVE